MIEKLKSLEDDLRRTRRVETKLQAMLYRLRKDVEDASGDNKSFNDLIGARSTQYDVDLLTEKCKVCHDDAKYQLAAVLT